MTCGPGMACGRCWLSRGKRGLEQVRPNPYAGELLPDSYKQVRHGLDIVCRRQGELGASGGAGLGSRHAHSGVGSWGGGGSMWGNPSFGGTQDG